MRQQTVDAEMNKQMTNELKTAKVGQFNSS